MALSVSHRFVSGKSDGTDNTQIQPSNWNDTHVITGSISNSFFNTDYNFAAQTPGGSLSIGSNTATLNPIPSGIAVGSYVLISGGTGTAEVCLITGWNSGTGQVIFTCANTHSGAWTLQSATTGIQEALVAARAVSQCNVGVVGLATIYVRIQLITNDCLYGQGPNSIIKIATGAYGSVGWSTASNSTMLDLQSGADSVVVKGLTIDTNSANATPGHGLNVAVQGLAITNCLLRDLTIKYYYSSGTGGGGGSVGSMVAFIGQCDNNTIDHLILVGPGDVYTVGSWFVGGIFIQGRYNKTTNCICSGVTDDGYVENLNAHQAGLVTYGNSWINNTYIGNSGAQVSAAFHSENTNGAQFVGNKVFGLVAIGFLVSPVGDGTGTDSAPAINTIIANNLVDSSTGMVGQGFKVIGLNSLLSSNQAGDMVTVTGNQFIGESQFGGVIAYNAYRVNVVGNLFANTTEYGIFLIGDANYNPQCINITGNIFYRCGTSTTSTAIYYSQQSTSGSVQPGNDITITNNIVFDDRSPKKTTVAVTVVSAQSAFTPTLTRWIIKDNNFVNVLTQALFGANYDQTCMIGPNLTPDTTNAKYVLPLPLAPTTYSTLPAANVSAGMLAVVTDSTTNTWGATIAGSGGDFVLAFCNGTNWTVAGK